MQAYQGKEGSLEVWTWGKEDCICLYADGPESGENPRKKKPFISLGFRNSSGHLSRHDLLVPGVSVKSQSQDSRAPVQKNCFLQVGEAGGGVWVEWGERKVC